MRKSSPAQLATFRRNLADETRSKVARNAFKHGLTSATIVLDAEDPERFQKLLNDLLAEAEAACPGDPPAPAPAKPSVNSTPATTPNSKTSSCPGTASIPNLPVPSTASYD